MYLYQLEIIKYYIYYINLGILCEQRVDNIIVNYYYNSKKYNGNSQICIYMILEYEMLIDFLYLMKVDIFVNKGGQVFEMDCNVK